jgi:hypothetical protein
VEGVRLLLVLNAIWWRFARLIEVIGDPHLLRFSA